MTSILKSEAAFVSRAEDCGLGPSDVAVLTGKGIKTLATLAYALTTPGATPSEDALRGLLNETHPDTVSLQALASLRRMVFEAQTLSIAQIKQVIENEGEAKVDLVPAERNQRLASQQSKLAGYDLTGPLECAHSCYRYVGEMAAADHPMYLEPHRFICRAQEISREKPGKELILDASHKISLQDRSSRDRCQIQTELQLSEALTRRALACDLMQVTTFSTMERYHRFLLSRLAMNPPPNHKRVSMEQLLRADRAAWIRLAELVTTLKRDPTGNLPLDAAIANLMGEPLVTFHLMPLPGKGGPKDETHEPGRARKGRGKKRDASGASKNPAGKGTGKVPSDLADPNLKHNTNDGGRICWNYNLAKACPFGKGCKRGAHLCMHCLGPHPLFQCKAYKTKE